MLKSQSHPQKEKIILIGMEAHICVLQTFLDLRAHNYEVYLPVDAIASSRSWEKNIALRRMEKNGGILTSVKSIGI